jgi:hypothetical protein
MASYQGLCSGTAEGNGVKAGETIMTGETPGISGKHTRNRQGNPAGRILDAAGRDYCGRMLGIHGGSHETIH